MQLIDSVEKHGKSKDLVSEKEEIGCNNLTKQHKND